MNSWWREGHYSCDCSCVEYVANQLPAGAKLRVLDEVYLVVNFFGAKYFVGENGNALPSDTALRGKTL